MKENAQMAREPCGGEVKLTWSTIRRIQREQVSGEERVSTEEYEAKACTAA